MDYQAIPWLRYVPKNVTATWHPNYVNPQTHGYALLTINCILLPITTAIVLARLYTRLRVVHASGLDDLFITLAIVSNCSLDPMCSRSELTVAGPHSGPWS